MSYNNNRRSNRNNRISNNNKFEKQNFTITIQKQNDEIKRYIKSNEETANAVENILPIGDQIIESEDRNLYIEYIQWDFINNILYKVGLEMLYIDNPKEYTNTLQRWFIYINEHFNEVPKFEYFPILPDIQMSDDSAKFLRDAFVEKGFGDFHSVNQIVGKLLKIIKDQHRLAVPFNLYRHPLTIKYDSKRHVIKVNEFTSPEVPRIALLINKAGLEATARMLLRYESFGNGSYQWGDPKEVHKVLHDKFQVKYEGFASPVNSRFIEYPECYFCSLFPETDGIFGSLGNFFDVDMELHKGGWSVNPPFLNDLMLRVAQHITGLLDREQVQREQVQSTGGFQSTYGGSYFFCTFPTWRDDEAWQLLSNTRHLYRKFDLKPSHFIVQDAYGGKFKPNMAMTMFVVGQLPASCKLTDLGNILIIDHFQSLPPQCPW